MTEPAASVDLWPPWDRDQPEELARYVVPEEVQTHCPGLPGRDDSGQLGRLRCVYDAFAARRSRYAHEALSADPRRQLIRPPDQVLRAPGEATCLDAALVFAGACLHAGLHPLVLVLDPRGVGEPAHAMVAVWLEGSWEGRHAPDYPRDEPLVTAGDDRFARGVRRELDLPGPFAVLDPSAGLQRPDREPASFEEAVALGVEALLGGDERLRAGVDVGLLRGTRPAHQPPGWPSWADGTSPLAQPYQDREGLDLNKSVKLLRAEYRAVPFQARDELDVLRDWCLNPAAPSTPRVAIVTGVGGAGKTRLAAELAYQLADQGWYTGFARSIEGGDSTLANWLATTVAPLLVVVDYAEARTDLVKELLRALRNRNWAATCLVLTARSMGEWTADVEKELVRGHHASAPLAVHLQPSHPEPARLYRRALSGLAEVLGSDRDTPSSPQWSERRSDWTTLDIVMLAWLAALGHNRQPKERADLYEEILGHERRYWREAHESRGLDGWSERLFDEAAACLALVEPTVRRAPAILGAVAELARDAQARWRGQVADSLARCLSSMDGRLGIKPDPIADHLILQVLGPEADGTPEGEPPLAVRCVERGNEWERWSALVNLTRAATQGPETAARLAGRLVSSVSGLWAPALALSDVLGGPFVDGMAEYALADGTELPLAELAQRVPVGHAHLRPLALAAATRLVHDRGSDDIAENARLLSNKAVRLSEAGRQKEALEAITEAVTNYRQLAGANPAAFLPGLAMSLNNQANVLSEVGSRQGALEAGTEAVSHYRQLASANPAAFLPDLAMALNNQATMLSEAGRRQEALEASTEAVSHYRQLGSAKSGAFLPDLAMAINNQATMLSEMGSWQEALEASTEAVSHYRQLEGINPGAFLPDLAASLDNQANRLSEVGSRQEALEVISEAVTIHRQLARANPAAFLPDLAASLINQATMLSDVGSRQEALEASSEAVTRYSQLASADPAAFLPNVATSLSNKANRLSQVGRRQEAMEAITEAVTRYRQLASADPAAFLPDLAGSLINQAIMLSEVGRRQEALEAISEAATRYRHLAGANPIVFLPDLAMALNNQANVLSQVGSRHEALEAINEAVTIRRQLAGANPAAFLPDLAGSLNNQATMLLQIGSQHEALEAISETATHYRQLAGANPAAFLPNLAGSLSNQATMLLRIGSREEALEAISEAVTHYRQLSDTDSAAFLPNLTIALNDQSNVLSEVGRLQEALDAITEAVTHYRQLAGANLAAFLPDLAMSLNNQANRLSEVGNQDEALEAITEAVAHYRQLADANPAAFLYYLAGSLNNQATIHAEVGRQQEALEAITEAVTHYRQLADADPSAFLPVLAVSLTNQANRLSEIGSQHEALEAITEAVTIRRQLAGANPAVFLSDLARSLSNQANMLSEVGRREKALEATTEAVTHYLQLAGTNPAAFLSDLATSLNNRATMLSEVGRRQEALDTWDRSVAALQHHPGHQAELRARRASWFAGRDEDAELLADLLAVASVDPDEPTELEALGRARRTARSLAGRLPPEARDMLPAWATTSISDEITSLADGWVRVAGGAQEALFLDRHAVQLDDPEVRASMALLAELHPGDRFLAHTQVVLVHAEAVSAVAAIAAVRDSNQVMRTLREWIATTTWSESRDVLEANRDLLLSEAVDAILEAAARTDPDADQHLGIVWLCRVRPIVEVYDAVTDVAEAADQAGEAIEEGDAAWLQGLLMACPDILEQPFSGPAAAGAFALLTGEPENAQQLLSAAADQGNDTQRRALAGRMKRLAARHPEHASAVAELAPLLRA